MRELVIVAVAILAASAGSAQTRSQRDTATTYGARLNAKGEPANVNQARINNRVDSRLDSRLSLRIERYRPESTENPTAAFRVQQDDKSRSRPLIAPPPPQDGTP